MEREGGDGERKEEEGWGERERDERGREGGKGKREEEKGWGEGREGMR